MPRLIDAVLNLISDGLIYTVMGCAIIFIVVALIVLFTSPPGRLR